MKSAIITLDIINEICHADGKLARYHDRIATKNMIANINQLTAWGRSQGYLIIHVRVGFNSGYTDSSNVSPLFTGAKNHNALLLDAWGGQYCENLDRVETDVYVTKHRVSAFYGTDLDLILRANRTETIFLCGVSTNNAVELTAREAHDRDYKVVVVSDATEASSDEEQQASLNFLEKISAVTALNDLIK